jgi:hypothetical protein
VDIRTKYKMKVFVVVLSMLYVVKSLGKYLFKTFFGRMFVERAPGM